MQDVMVQEGNLNTWVEENSNFDVMSVPVQPVVVVESKPPSFVNSHANQSNVTGDDIDIDDYFGSGDYFAVGLQALANDQTADGTAASHQNIAPPLQTISNEELSDASSGQPSLQSSNNAYRLHDGLNREQPAIVKQQYKRILPKQDWCNSLIATDYLAIQFSAPPNLNPQSNSDEHSPALNPPKRKNRSEKTPQQRFKAKLHCKNFRERKKQRDLDLQETCESQAKMIKGYEEKIEKLEHENAGLQSQLKTRYGQMCLQRRQMQIQSHKIDELKEQIKNLHASFENEKYMRVTLEKNFSERLSVLEVASSLDQIMNASLEEEVDKHFLLHFLKRLETLEERLLPTSGEISAACREPDLSNIKRFLHNFLKRIEALEEKVQLLTGKDL